MNITSDQNTTANAGVTALQSALASYAAIYDPAAKNVFARDNLMPLNTEYSSLACTLGQALLTEQLSTAQTALTPYVLSQVELTRAVNELGAIRHLRGQVKGITDCSALDASSAANRSGLIASVLQAVLAVAVVS